jgi:putative transposase
VKFQVIEAFKYEFPVKMMAGLLGVSNAGVYRARKRPASTRNQHNCQLSERIRQLFHQHKKRYGSPRIYHDLRLQGETCGRHRVARLMQQMDLRAVYRNRHTPRINRVVQLGSAAPNLVERQFEVDKPNRVWLGDITQFPTREGWLYLAANMDLFSRRIVGWSMLNRYDTRLVVNAIDQARQSREISAGLIVHTDQGSQYRAGDYRSYLKRHGICASMSRKGDCWDNAPMESFFKSLKTEIGNTSNQSRPSVVRQLVDYIEGYYNPKRLHSSIGYHSPIEFERRNGE